MSCFVFGGGREGRGGWRQSRSNYKWRGVDEWWLLIEGMQAKSPKAGHKNGKSTRQS